MDLLMQVDPSHRGGRGSNGSRALQAGLSRCRRIRSSTRRSVMIDNLQFGATGTEKRVHLIENIIKLRT